MHTLAKHPLVDCDVEAAALWYHARDPGIAERLIDEIRNAMRAAAADPLRHAIRFDDVRRVRVRRFPHSVYFQVRAETVLVLAVIHGAREVEQILTARKPVT
jgi:plasmid stabilization system protein ParE